MSWPAVQTVSEFIAICACTGKSTERRDRRSTEGTETKRVGVKGWWDTIGLHDVMDWSEYVVSISLTL